MVNVESALQSAQNVVYESSSASPYTPHLLEQPFTAVNYGESNRQANQDYDWTSEQKFL